MDLSYGWFRVLVICWCFSFLLAFVMKATCCYNRYHSSKMGSEFVSELLYVQKMTENFNFHGTLEHTSVCFHFLYQKLWVVCNLHFLGYWMLFIDSWGTKAQAGGKWATAKSTEVCIVTLEFFCLHQVHYLIYSMFIFRC